MTLYLIKLLLSHLTYYRVGSISYANVAKYLNGMISFALILLWYSRSLSVLLWTLLSSMVIFQSLTILRAGQQSSKRYGEKVHFPVIFHCRIPVQNGEMFAHKMKWEIYCWQLFRWAWDFVPPQAPVPFTSQQIARWFIKVRFYSVVWNPFRAQHHTCVT